jgi:hypothetical protein
MSSKILSAEKMTNDDEHYDFYDDDDYDDYGGHDYHISTYTIMMNDYCGNDDDTDCCRLTNDHDIRLTGRCTKHHTKSFHIISNDDNY